MAAAAPPTQVGAQLRTFLSSPSPPGSRSNSRTRPAKSQAAAPVKPSNPADDPSQTSPATITALPTASPPSLTALRRDLAEKGYCIIPQLYSSKRLDDLRTAAASLAVRAREGDWRYVRTLPKQFPPWPVDDVKEKGIWGIQHLLHPEMDASVRREFLQLYFDEQLLQVCEGLLRGEACEKVQEQEEPLVMELFNMLVRPTHDFGLRWHRDSVPFDNISIEEEVELLGLDRPTAAREAHHVQYNIPLYRDQSLILVPGSHRRPRTTKELELLSQDAYVKELPNMLVVDAQPGDVIFYDNNVIHMGHYDSTVERMTLHGCVGDVKGGNARARNILQHGIGAWVEDCEFSALSESARERAEKMKQNLLSLGSSVGEEARRGIHDD